MHEHRLYTGISGATERLWVANKRNSGQPQPLELSRPTARRPAPYRVRRRARPHDLEEFSVGTTNPESNRRGSVRACTAARALPGPPPRRAPTRGCAFFGFLNPEIKWPGATHNRRAALPLSVYNRTRPACPCMNHFNSEPADLSPLAWGRGAGLLR